VFSEEADMRFRVSLAAICAVCFTLSASAHHSHGQYEQTFKDIQGVVKEVHLLVPHSWVYMEVKDAKGEPQLWALEATGRMGLERLGVTPEYIKPGDAIKVRCHPLRDGTNGCLLGFVTPMHGDAARGAGIEREWD